METSDQRQCQFWVGWADAARFEQFYCLSFSIFLRFFIVSISFLDGAMNLNASLVFIWKRSREEFEC